MAPRFTRRILSPAPPGGDLFRVESGVFHIDETENVDLARGNAVVCTILSDRLIGPITMSVST